LDKGKSVDARLPKASPMAKGKRPPIESDLITEQKAKKP
jgi:hypothetical protein